MKQEISEELQTAIKSLIDRFDQDEQAVRQRQIRLWKKLELYWNGITHIYYDEVAHDWRVYDNYGTDDAGYYNKPINVYRAYLETIIAAMSATVPAIKCKPDDADVIADVLTARGGTKIAELVYEHIDAPLLWIKALWCYCIYGMIAAYNYTAEDEEYGTVKVAQYKDEEVDVQNKYCPNCGQMISQPELDLSKSMIQAEKDEFDPGDEDILLHDQLNQGKFICSNCMVQMDPEIREEKIIVQRLTGEIHKPKARQCVEINGGLYVKVPNYARCQKDTPYIGYEYETHISNVYKCYPDLRDKVSEGSLAGGYNEYEKWGRLNPQYYGEYPKATPTVRNWWLRSSAFESLADDELRKEVKKKFPNGCKVVFVNDTFAEAKNESLDDHWTLTYNPLSEYIHFDPAGLGLTSIQEVTNDLISLILQTIEHGIPQTFADPSVLSFDEYGKAEVRPGDIYQAKAKGGKSLSDGFYQISTATLSQEVEPFGQRVQEYGQFVSGALPSLFGGNQANSSRTAAQYSMSRNQALQRLQLPWKMINFWWKGIFSKVIPAYIKNMLDDERIVKEEHGSFINIVIKKSELDGKLGDITLESSQELPITWGQKREILMNLLEMNNPEILASLGAPENIAMLNDLIGLSDLSMPGESDREKQFEEIDLLIKSAPLQPPSPQGPGQSSIPPEFEVDNHQVQAEICRHWLVSEAGRQVRIDNQEGYTNVLLHLQEHMQMLQQLTQPAPQQQPQGGEGKEKQLRPLPGKQNANQSA